MIKEGDKVMLGLSGGKDSLTMLHCLLQLQRRSPIKFELACVTVDPQTTGFDPRWGRRRHHTQCAARLLQDARREVLLRVARRDRARQEEAAERLHLLVVLAHEARHPLQRDASRGLQRAGGSLSPLTTQVLAQHLDDLAESFLMSVFHNGELRTMKACYMNKEKDIRVIRPFVYVREKQLREFAKTMNLPIIDENCPACFEGSVRCSRSIVDRRNATA